MSPLKKLRALCLALPEAHEVEAWGEPTFRVKNKLFAMYASPDNHHGAGRHCVWLHCAPENQRELVAMEPERYFVPPYVGKSGWVGVWIDKRPRWKEVEALVRDAYRRVAPGAPFQFDVDQADTIRIGPRAIPEHVVQAR